MKSIRLISLAITMLISLLTFGQEKDISGTVLENLSPLPGATILIKGTQRRTQTNFDGKFNLKVKAKDTIVISYIGMKTQKIAVEDKTTIEVKLIEEIKLEEKIPEGTGIWRKKTALKDVTIVSKNDLQVTKPLYVLNGLPITLEQVKLLDSDKIISTTTLKGTQATALFGEQAIGGATIIITKKMTKRDWKKYNKLSEEGKVKFKEDMIKELIKVN